MPTRDNGAVRPSYVIDLNRCTHCAGCASVCPAGAMEIDDTRAEITAACRRCANCLRFCPVGAVRVCDVEAEHV
ncbi:MAG: 4Fe-4S dicluster domain-containing protein [Chitinivibrionales bacterium]|nr:4Fe-4S dicluster domain-containing protein [Chitinivibrionales bacterium]